MTGRGRHEIVVRWQLAVGTAVRAADGMAVVTSPAGVFSVTIAATAPALTAETRPVAAGSRSTTDASVLTCRINAVLPVRATTAWSRARDRSAKERCRELVPAAHAGFLRRHLEYDVGGNHLIKGLKALAGLAVFFADERLLRLALRRLARQLSTQVLSDGGHYERAPAYHCQVLADLIDMADLLRAAGQAPAGELGEAIDRMRHWLGAVLTPDGEVPLLNDGYPVDRELLAALRPAPPPAPGTPDGLLLVLPATGLVRAVVGGWHLLADVGPPCPPSLPAHSHADTFGCLVHVDKTPLLIDTGTSTYAPGPVRRRERSTAAHNTVQVDGADSTEVWAVFRAGRRARVSGLAVRADSSAVSFEAAHDGFRRLPGRPRHHRRWSLTSDGLRVDNVVAGRGRREIVIRWQLAPGSAIRVADGAALVTSPAGAFCVAMTASHPTPLAAEIRPVAAGFGSAVDAPVLTCRVEAALPVRVSTVWSRARGRAEGGGTA